MRHPALLLLPLLLASCFDPDPSKILVTCSEADPFCPSGSVCNVAWGCCVGSGLGARTCLPKPSADLGSAADLAGVPPPDLATPYGCREAGGFRPDPASLAWACPGSFEYSTTNTVRMRCAKGTHELCKAMPFASAATCLATNPVWSGRFFVGDGRISGDNLLPPITQNPQCRWGNILRAVGGCGSAVAARDAPISCAGWSRYWPCNVDMITGGATGDFLACSDAIQDARFNELTLLPAVGPRTGGEANGVLCCPVGM